MRRMRRPPRLRTASLLSTAGPRSRIYRILMGLLFLAWTLPFLLQMLQYFRDAFARLFP